MSQTPKNKTRFSIFIVVSIFLFTALTACANTPPTPAPRVRPADIEVANVPPATPTVAPEAIATAVSVPTDEGCVKCHTDEEMLKATEKEEEVVESLSEGEG